MEATPEGRGFRIHQDNGEQAQRLLESTHLRLAEEDKENRGHEGDDRSQQDMDEAYAIVDEVASDLANLQEA